MEELDFISASYNNNMDNVYVFINKYHYSPSTVENADRISSKKDLALKGTD